MSEAWSLGNLNLSVEQSAPPPRPHGFKDPLVPASGKECFLEPQATISFFQKLIPKENQKHQLSLVS